MSNYPDDISGAAICGMEGCASPNCSRCGTVNYHWLGYLGARASAAKRWGVSLDEAEERITRNQARKDIRVLSRSDDPEDKRIAESLRAWLAEEEARNA